MCPFFRNDFFTFLNVIPADEIRLYKRPYNSLKTSEMSLFGNIMQNNIPEYKRDLDFLARIRNVKNPRR